MSRICDESRSLVRAQLALHPDCVEALAAKNVFETAMSLVKTFTGVKGVGAPVVEASLTVIWNAICGAVFAITDAGSYSGR